MVCVNFVRKFANYEPTKPKQSLESLGISKKKKTQAIQIGCIIETLQQFPTVGNLVSRDHSLHLAGYIKSCGCFGGIP